MDESKNYVYRLMRARCQYGTMDNYLNINKDHGILANEDMQPLLNANDHTNETVIHFGDCNSDCNPELYLRKGLFTILGGPTGFLLGEALDKLGVMSIKCKPQTPNPWEFVDETHMIDGAPAITLQSELSCKNGGTITLVPLGEYPKEEDVTPSDIDEPVPEPSPYLIIQQGIENSLNSAFEKVKTTGEVSETVEENVQAALLVSSTMYPPELSSMANKFSEEQLQEFSIDNNQDYENAIFDIVTVDERNKNYANNLRTDFKNGTFNDEGMIVKQSLMTNHVINNTNMAHSGCGVISIYNTFKILDVPDQDINLAHIIYHLEPYGVSNNAFGILPNGVTNYLNEQGYDTDIVFGDDNIETASKNSKANIMLYATMSNVHYVAYEQTGVNADGEEIYTFYNDSIYVESTGNYVNTGTMNDFLEELDRKTDIAKMLITVN